MFRFNLYLYICIYITYFKKGGMDLGFGVLASCPTHARKCLGIEFQYLKLFLPIPDCLGPGWILYGRILIPPHQENHV